MTPSAAPRRPIVRWYGVKWKLAPWIIAHLPPHKVYVEPFGGGGSVLMRKPRSHAEVWNDLDGEIVNVFRVLRDEAMAARLMAQLELTPFARDELTAAYDLTDEPVERARRLIVLSFMGFGSNAHARVPTGFRNNSTRSGTTPAGDWRNYPGCMPAMIDRLRGVIIENRDACEVMAQMDGADTVHYADPPYVHATRAQGNPYDAQYRGYAHEMDDADHARLLDFLDALEGAVVLSGYPHPLYEDRLKAWQRFEIAAHADGARDRTEVLWLNPRCWARLGKERQRGVRERQDSFDLGVLA